jgi:hypothetical protein
VKKQILLLQFVALKAADSSQNTYAYKLCDIPVHDRKTKRHCRYEQGGLTRHSFRKHTDGEGGLTRHIISGFKKLCVLMYEYYTGIEFESTVLFLLNVYWSSAGAA